MDQTTALVVVAAILVASLIIWMFFRQRRTAELRHRFGPEYERLVREKGNPSLAEAELEHRLKRAERLSIRPLPPERRARFTERWQQHQSRFVDEPRAAIEDVDHLVEEVMVERGYPVGEFEQHVADISVDHPRVVETYRAAHDVARGGRSVQATTEDLRLAMISYRELFMELLEDPMPKGLPSR